MEDGYQALREGAAWFDLSARGRIRVTGRDRTRLLHAITTNHIQQLKPGQGCYAFFLNAQGRILGDVNLLCLADAFLLDTEPETRLSTYEHIAKYIIADDVTLEDATEETAALGVEGPESGEILRALAMPQPEAPYSYERSGERMIARLSATGAPGFRIFAPREEMPQLVEQLESAGAVSAAPDEIRAVRLELGTPRYGEDICDKYLPQETQLLHAVHFDKGCYLGQEIVERVRSRGSVHRFLVRLEIDSSNPPEADAQILADGKARGEVTSAAYSPASGKVAALGYVRLGETAAGAPLTIAGAAARIVSARPGPES